LLWKEVPKGTWTDNTDARDPNKYTENDKKMLAHEDKREVVFLIYYIILLYSIAHPII
jgi:hypothetical protein